MKKYAVIVAAGSGTRMGAEVPKQFLLIDDKPVLYYSVKSFLEAFEDMQVILVVATEYVAATYEVVDKWFGRQRVIVTVGGSTRFQSVKNGLACIKEESIVFVHDAVRCMVSTELIKRCYSAALENGNAVPAIPSKDSIRLQSEDDNEVYDRSKVMLIQTPQTFHSKILIPAYQIDYKDQYTDEATVVEAFGIKIHLVEGEENNIKITRPVDLVVARSLLS